MVVQYIDTRITFASVLSLRSLGEEEDAGEIEIPTGSGEIDVPTSPTGTVEAQHGAGITEVEQPPRRSIRERKPPDVFDPCTYRGMGASD